MLGAADGELGVAAGTGEGCREAVARDDVVSGARGGERVGGGACAARGCGEVGARGYHVVGTRGELEGGSREGGRPLRGVGAGGVGGGEGAVGEVDNEGALGPLAGDGRAVVVARRPEGELAGAYVQNIGGVAQLVDVPAVFHGECAAVARGGGCGKLPAVDVAREAFEVDGLQGGKGGAAIVGAHVGGGGERLGGTGLLVVDEVAVGVVTHEAPEVLVGQRQRTAHGDGGSAVVVGNAEFGGADGEGVPLRVGGKLPIGDGGGNERRGRPACQHAEACQGK